MDIDYDDNVMSLYSYLIFVLAVVVVVMMVVVLVKSAADSKRNLHEYLLNRIHKKNVKTFLIECLSRTYGAP